MVLDVATLLFVVAIASSLAGAQLLWAWHRNREVPALFAWSVSFFLGSGANFAALAERPLGQFLSLSLANMLAMAAFAAAFAGARILAGKRPRFDLALTGPLLFLLFTRLPPFETSFNLQLSLGSLLGAAFLFAACGEIWSNPAKLSTQIPAAAIFAVHGCVLSVRGILAHVLGASPPQGGGIIFIALAVEAVAFIINASFFLTSLAKEQIETSHRNAALLDPLTGLANRRGFFAEAERLLARRRGQSLAVILFDLDHFKTINDNFGHHVGDKALRLFASVMRSSVLKDDIVARIGGEEFALVMPATLARGTATANTVVSEFAKAASIVEGMPILATVSAGIAASAEDSFIIDLVLVRADRALYRAKALGRNRAEIEPPAAEKEQEVLPGRAA